MDTGELSGQDYPGTTPDTVPARDGVSDDPRSTGSRASADADAIAAGQEQAPAAPDDTASSPDAGTVSSEGQPTEDAGLAAGTGVDRGGQDAQPGQPDSTGPPDTPGPPGGDSQADTSPDARIAELQAQLAKANAELAQTKGELDKSNGERDKIHEELDQAKGQLTEIKTELDQANHELAGLRASGPEHGSTAEDAQKPPDAGQAPADASHPEQQAEGTDTSRGQDASLGKNEVADREGDANDANQRAKLRVRHVVSPDNIAIGAAVWDAQDAVQKLAAHSMHDAASPSIAVVLGITGVVLSKFQEYRKEKNKND